MRFQQSRYLWVQVVGLAAVPLLLDVCLVGLASSGLAVPYGIQFWAIAFFGIAPPLWMQLAKPFYVFSLPPVALNPNVLSDDQHRCLRLLQSWQVKALAGLTAVFSLWVLLQLYAESSQIMPMMTPRVGLISAAVAFFFSCAFLQISVSAVRVLLVGSEALKRVVPYETSAIAGDFLILGFRVKRILPEPLAARLDLPEDPPPPEARAPVDETLVQYSGNENLNSENLAAKDLVAQNDLVNQDQDLDDVLNEQDIDDHAPNHETSGDEENQSDSNADSQDF
ncbi:MAG: low-complexity tail membrane protein [Phormidesmis sp.]